MITRLASSILLISLVSAQYYNQNQNQNQNQNIQPTSGDALTQQQQYGYGNTQQNFGERRGVINQVLTPYNNSMNDVPINGGVTIQFQLRGYSNPSSSLPNSQTCICPIPNGCTQLKNIPTCYFSFTFIISSPDQSVRYLATDFITLDRNGQLPNLGGQAKRWDENFVVQLPTKPSAIDIFAHHMGAVYNLDGNLAKDDNLVHADTFVVPLNSVVPAVGGVQSMNSQMSFDGKLMGTKLTLSFSIACSGTLIGPNCDLSCTQSQISTQTASCRSNTTGFFYVCNYLAGNQGQVDNCKNCPWGVRDNTYCQDEQGLVLDPHTAGVVDTSFKTATIVLSILCGVMLLVLLLTCVMCLLMRRKATQSREREMTTYGKNNGPPTQPLLQASFRQNNDPPTPVPRSLPPSLETKPIKSALRKPMIPQNSSNDTRDTSFSDVPMRPSRSEVV